MEPHHDRPEQVGLSAEAVIRLLDLRPLPHEGGYFAETYRAGSIPPAALPPAYPGPRPRATAIYYLVTPDSFSALHRLPGDEIFHFYLGDPVEQLQLSADGSGRVLLLGPDLRAGQRPQLLVPGGTWQGARLRPGGHHGFALLGTTMSPGFEFADYEAGDREALTKTYPAFRPQIEALTR